MSSLPVPSDGPVPSEAAFQAPEHTAAPLPHPPAGNPRQGPRSLQEVEAERQQLRDQTARQIDALIAEFHAQLPRERARHVGAVYARHSTRFQHSVVDQVRGCLEEALRTQAFIPRELVFFDLAVRGAKQRRPGLDGLKAVLARQGVQVVFIFTTNRLARKTYRALQFVEEELVGRGIRGVFVKSHVDTANGDQWRLLLSNFAAIDEFVTTMYADNIRIAHQGLARLKLVFGTITFGYRAQPVAGPPTKRQRPRAEYQVDPDTAAWVRTIFRWFVDLKLSIAEIVRRLNGDSTAPLPPKAVSGRWTRLGVKLLLANPRYRGEWLYGKTETVWQPRQDYARQVSRDEPLEKLHFEELRIVDDATWFAAARRLAERGRRSAGRKPRDGDRTSRPRLLNGLFVCPAHDRPLYVGGAFGTLMHCPVCQALPAGERPLYSLLNREVGLRLTCARLAEVVQLDPALLARIVEACGREAAAAQQPDPARLAELQSKLDRLSRQIQFVLENPGETESDRQESVALLRKLRAERAERESERAALEAAQSHPPKVPTAEEVRELLKEMGVVLAKAATGGVPEDAGPAREVVELLTGGRIELEQAGERKAQRGWLRGRFRVRLLDAAVAKLTGVVPGPDGDGLEVAIDYREPTEAERWADKVKDLYDRGLLINAIAAELGINRNLARLALAAWSERTGELLPDGRSRRSTLGVQQTEPPLYQRVAEEVKVLLDEGLLMRGVAERLGIDRDTVTAAMRFWYTSRGLAVPDGRTRRKGLPGKGDRA
jgi:DNA invertase Pin-like site-specific DNA recombinase